METISNLRADYPGSFLLEYIEKCKYWGNATGHEMIRGLDALVGKLNNEDILSCLAKAHKEIHCSSLKCKPNTLPLWQKAFIEALYLIKAS